MSRPGATLAKWLGHAFLLAVPYVIFCAVLWPTGIQVLNPVTCSGGRHLDNRASGPTSGEGDLELVCRAKGVVENATVRVVVVVVVLAVLSGAFYLLSQRLANPRTRRPVVPRGG